MPIWKPIARPPSTTSGKGLKRWLSCVAVPGWPSDGGIPKAEELARDILGTIEARKSSKSGLALTDPAVAAQACIALDQSEEALSWIAEYAESPEVDIFDLQSLWNQLLKAWDLTLSSPPGNLLLRVLKSHILSRGGHVELTFGEISPLEEEERTVLSRVLSSEGNVVSPGTAVAWNAAGGRPGSRPNRRMLRHGFPGPWIRFRSGARRRDVVSALCPRGQR